MAEVGKAIMDPAGELIDIDDILKKMNIPNIVQAILGMDYRRPGDLISMLGLMRKKEAAREKKYTIQA